MATAQVETVVVGGAYRLGLVSHKTGMFKRDGFKRHKHSGCFSQRLSSAPIFSVYS
jgi:hypothetical protein